MEAEARKWRRYVAVNAALAAVMLIGILVGLRSWMDPAIQASDLRVKMLPICGIAILPFALYVYAGVQEGRKVREALRAAHHRTQATSDPAEATAGQTWPPPPAPPP